ncbi:uncharacterized protein DC041_0004997, partial [Schistosoma bovis]
MILWHMYLDFSMGKHHLLNCHRKKHGKVLLAVVYPLYYSVYYYLIFY